MRKTKLMALLLAALMVVAAFAGCAGVKEEDLDALDVRVKALEDLLNGQQKTLDEIKSTVGNQDYSEILDAIEDVKKDLQDKIDDVNSRIDDEIGKGTTTGVSDETKAAQQKALALIEVRRVEFGKASDDYTADEYTKIYEALGTATGAVNAATTTEAVNAAMSALTAELAKYMTYAQKAYDYYTQLLGNINDDAKDLVEEVKEFIKAVDKVYTKTGVTFKGKLDATTTTSANEVQVELAYLVSEGDYIDVYTALVNLCELYSTTTAGTVADIPYVDAKGKVTVEEDVKSLKDTKADAEALVKNIENVSGKNMIYASTAYNTVVAATYRDEYETYVEAAEFLGGDKLVALITNIKDLTAAEATADLVTKAANAYDKATRVSAANYKDVFYYYTELTNKTYLENGTVWTADEYAKVEEILNDWIKTYELSNENVKAIVNAKEGSTTFYDNYVSDAHEIALLVKACNEFKTVIVPKIKALNASSKASVDLALAYDEVEDLFENLLILQVKDTKADAPYNKDYKIELEGANAAKGNANIETIIKNAELFDDYANERYTDAASYVAKWTDTNGLIKLYTFAADKKEIEARTTNNVYFDATNNNIADGSIFKFLTTEYQNIKTIANAINATIKDLANKVEKNAISSDEEFVDLEGKYIALSDSDKYTTDGKDFGDGYYVAVEKKYNTAATLKAYYDTITNADDYTIEAFLYKYADFEQLLDLDKFNTAKATMNTRVVELFDLADKFVDDFKLIDYVDTSKKVYKDSDKDGAYTSGEDVTANYVVSLNDANDVATAVASFNAWVKMGGSVSQSMFKQYTDDDGKAYDVYVMYGYTGTTGNTLKSAMNEIHKLDSQISSIKTLANNFINHISAIAKIEAYSAIAYGNLLYNNDGSVQATTTSVGNSTIIAASTFTENSTTKTKYTYVNTNSSNGVKSDNTQTVTGSKPSSVSSAIDTRSQFLYDTVKAYEAFVNANVEYVKDADGNYAQTGYAAYDAVDTAIKSYSETYDLLVAKAIVLKVCSVTGYNNLLQPLVKAATSCEQLTNVVNSYMSNEDVKNILSSLTANDLATKLNTYTVYDFSFSF